MQRLLTPRGPLSADCRMKELPGRVSWFGATEAERRWKLDGGICLAPTRLSCPAFMQDYCKCASWISSTLSSSGYGARSSNTPNLATLLPVCLQYCRGVGSCPIKPTYRWPGEESTLIRVRLMLPNLTVFRIETLLIILSTDYLIIPKLAAGGLAHVYIEGSTIQRFVRTLRALPFNLMT
jgi:hypothetical protein